MSAARRRRTGFHRARWLACAVSCRLVCRSELGLLEELDETFGLNTLGFWKLRNHHRDFVCFRVRRHFGYGCGRLDLNNLAKFESLEVLSKGAANGLDRLSGSAAFVLAGNAGPVNAGFRRKVFDGPTSPAIGSTRWMVRPSPAAKCGINAMSHLDEIKALLDKAGGVRKPGRVSARQFATGGCSQLGKCNGGATTPSARTAGSNPASRFRRLDLAGLSYGTCEG